MSTDLHQRRNRASILHISESMWGAPAIALAADPRHPTRQGTTQCVGFDPMCPIDVIDRFIDSADIFNSIAVARIPIVS